MELRTAFALIEATLEEGRRRNARPLSVVVLDPGGHQIASAREDGAGFARLALAQGKAWGSLGLGFGSRTLSFVDTSRSSSPRLTTEIAASATPSCTSASRAATARRWESAIL